MYGHKSAYSEELVEKFFKRLAGCNGNIKLTCQVLGISPSTPQNWKREHPEFAERLAKATSERRGDRWYYI